jgi:hypothetical protein
MKLEEIPIDRFMVDLGIKFNRYSGERTFIQLEKAALAMSLLFVKGDTRVSRGIEFWFYVYGKYLSTQKLKKVLKNSKVDIDYHPQSLAGLLKIASINESEKNQFGPVLKMIDLKDKKEIFVPELMKRIRKAPKDKIWESVGIVAPLFNYKDEKELNHFVENREWIIKFCPELSMRIKGYTTSVADFRAVFKVIGKVSAYRAAKLTDISLARAYRIFSNFEIAD